MPRFNKQESSMILLTLLLGLTPNGPYIASSPASGNHGCRYGTDYWLPGHTLQWNLPNNINKLCHRCGKLGCTPNQCSSRQDKGRTRGRNPVAALKEQFHINQPAKPKERSRLRSKDPRNFQSSQPKQLLANTRSVSNPHWNRPKSADKCDFSVSFSTILRTPPPLSSPNQAITMSPHEAANILSLLKSLQQDIAEVRDHITTLEFNDRRMTHIEQHLGLLPPLDIPAINQTSDMLIDALAISDSTVALVSSQSTAPPVQTPLNPLSPGFIPTRPVKAPLSASVNSPIISPTSSTSHMTPSPSQTCDEIQAINAKHLAIENKLDMLTNSISSFIGSITSSSSSSNSAGTAGSN
ncbi:hypothetical protein RCL_jg16083.t1 [Rhizophagus clarus]|uniref:CCHC-type domain-containing protein n=1 Tax=Rhizophagus clarus TaxID=94130 RepID=A0A8H3L853_9GLOM|nr:hypothetical protein RCL_jg16083.t1 [Rhizophagus clarus]